MIAKVIPAREMMEEHSSYHQSISGDEAERRLRDRNRHGYLTRYSARHERYILTVFQLQTPSDVIKHFKIAIDENRRYKIERMEQDFETIEALLGHYERIRIDPALRTIGRNYTEDDYKEFERNRLHEARVRNRQREGNGHHEGNRVPQPIANRQPEDHRELNGVDNVRQDERNNRQHNPQDRQQGEGQQRREEHRRNRQQPREEYHWCCPLL